MDYNGGPGMVPFNFHIFWLAGVLVFVVGAILLIVWAIRSAARPAYQIGPQPMQMGSTLAGATRETPLEILARRFASGEITAEEFERGRDLLGGGPKT